MAPRNIRSIPPWKLIQILEAFSQASKEADWDHSVKKLLENKNLKKDFKSYDDNPGGDRTYLAQLICLGFVYKDEEKKIQFTKAGRDYLNGHSEPLLILRKLLLKQQYPSVYSASTGVNISADVQVKPILFLLDIINELENIKTGEGYLTREDIAAAVIYGRNQDCLKKCVQKILNIRKGSTLESQIDDEDDLWTVKTQNTPLSKKLENILDIANTFDNWMASAQLVVRIKENGRYKSYINTQLYGLIEEERKLGLIEEDINAVKKGHVSFQRRFGSWDGGKDTASPAPTEKLSAEEFFLKNQLIEVLASDLVSDQDLDKFKDRMLQLGLTETLINKAVLKYRPQNASLFEDEYINLSVGGPSKGLSFEEATHKLFLKLGMKAARTGQLVRKDSIGSYADIVVSLGDRAVIIDTKASEKYTIPSTDHAKACHNYIANWQELRTLHGKTESSHLSAFCYIAGGFYPLQTLNSKLEQIKKDSGTPASAIEAWDFFKYVQKNPQASPEDFMNKAAAGKHIKLNG